MISCSRPVQHDAVLTAVKATPFGWPAASLDPGSGRRPSTRTNSRGLTGVTEQDPPIRVFTLSGDGRVVIGGRSRLWRDCPVEWDARQLIEDAKCRARRVAAEAPSTSCTPP
jgi:hypothetical protein